MTTPLQYANQLATLHAQFHAGTISQAQYASGLASAITSYDSVGTLADRLQAVIDLNNTIISSIRLFEAKGMVDLVSNLPTNASPGDFYIITTGEFREHGFMRVGSVWADMGQIRGPIGVTPNLAVGTVTTVSSGEPAKVTISGSAEFPIVDFELPRGHDARHGISVNASYALEAGEILATYVAPVDEVYDAAASTGVALVVPTSTAVVAIKRRAPGGAETSWGTITWAAGAERPTFDIPNPQLPAGHALVFQAPATPDPTLASIAWTLMGAI